jgi:hypothetical protein
MIAVIVAASRVLEERIRTSRALRRAARRALFVLSRVSPEVRDYVRIRLRRIV